MRDENETKISRRAAMKRSLFVLGAAAIAPTALAACGGEEAASGGGACGDVTLTPAQTQLRTTLSYVDVGPDASKHCSACALYTAGSPCGTCTVVQGPIASGGTCNSFAPKTT